MIDPGVVPVARVENGGATDGCKKIDINGIDIVFDARRTACLWVGMPVVTMWVESSMAGLMQGMRRMVGERRFQLALQSGGRDSVEGDWKVVSAYPTFEDGFRALAEVAWPAGWGRWEIVSIDRTRREGRFRVWNNWEALYQAALGAVWGSNMLAGKLAGLCSRLFDTNCWAEQTAHAAGGDPCDEFVVRPSERTVEDELARILCDGEADVADLPIALERLEREIDERKLVEEELRGKIALIERQREDILAMSTPIVQIWRGVLLLPIIGSLDTGRANHVMEKLLDAIVRLGARAAILDLTGVEQVDTATADHLLRIVRAVQLLGANSVITGIRPALAQTITALGVDLTGIVTLAILEQGLAACIRSMRERPQEWSASGRIPNPWPPVP